MEKSKSRRSWDLYLRSSWSWKTNLPLSGSCTFHATHLSKSKQHKTLVWPLNKQYWCSSLSLELFHGKIPNERTHWFKFNLRLAFVCESRADETLWCCRRGSLRRERVEATGFHLQQTVPPVGSGHAEVMDGASQDAEGLSFQCELGWVSPQTLQTAHSPCLLKSDVEHTAMIKFKRLYEVFETA